MKVTKELAEMTDGTVQLLSLVEAGASGAPFKRLKSEETDVFTPEKSKPIEDEPRLIALAVSEDGDVAAARAIAEASGVEILEERETEGTTLLITKAEARINTLDPAQIVVQLDDELAAVCEVQKTFIPFTGTTSFAEAIKAQGYFPQLGNALETFAGVAYQILEDASSPSAAASDIQKAGEEFTTLVASLTKALPKETFKMAETLKAIKEEAPAEEATEEVVEETAAEETVEKDETETEETTEEAAAEESTETEEVVEKEDETTEEAETETETEEVEKTDETAEAAEETEEVVEETAPESELSLVLKAIEALSATVAEQGEAQAALKEQVEAVAQKADEAAETADATETAVKGRVSTSPAPDGRTKEDVAPRGAPPLQDTGMASVRKR